MKSMIAFLTLVLLVAPLITTSSAENANTTTYEIKDNECGEVNFPTKWVSIAKKVDPNLKIGTCSSVDYTVPNGTTTKKTPIGVLTVHLYKKPSLLGGAPTGLFCGKLPLIIAENMTVRYPSIRPSIAQCKIL